MSSGRKIVKRRWTTSTGEVREKIYTYEDTSGILVGRSGKVNEDLYQATLRNFKENMDFSSYLDAKQDLQDMVSQYSEKNRLHPEQRGMSLKTFLSKMETNKIKKMFINAGVDLDYAAKKAGVSVQELLNEENWGVDRNGDPIFKMVTIDEQKHKHTIKFRLQFYYKKRTSWADVSHGRKKK